MLTLESLLEVFDGDIGIEDVYQRVDVIFLLDGRPRGAEFFVAELLVALVVPKAGVDHQPDGFAHGEFDELFSCHQLLEELRQGIDVACPNDPAGGFATGEDAEEIAQIGIMLDPIERYETLEEEL